MSRTSVGAVGSSVQGEGRVSRRPSQRQIPIQSVSRTCNVSEQNVVCIIR